ncbi:MAG: CHAP domain-containing protein [Streptococcus sp.]|nr:MAG: CHAP domain-containing protein [Streptococcus sp.]
MCYTNNAFEMNCIKKEFLFMLNFKSRIVLSSLSALGLIGVGVTAHHADENLINSLSNVKTPTVKAESKQISDSKKSEEQSVTTYSAPAASIGSTIGSEIASSIENKTNNISTNDDTVKQNVEPVVESKSVDETNVTESEQDVESKLDDITDTTNSEQDVEPVVESENNISVDNSETNIVSDVALTTEPVVEQLSDKDANLTNSEVNSQDSDMNDVASKSVVQEPVFKTIEVVEHSEPIVEAASANVVETKENKSVTEVTTESVSETSVVETSKVSEPIVEAPVVHEEVKPSVLSVSHDQSNTYPVGQCTWGVKSLAPWVGNYWGNANQWGDSARRAGFRTGHTPQVGSVIVFPNVMYEGENYGHVAYVTAVNNDGTIEVLEANWGGNQQIGNYRGAFTPSSDAYYIYPNN